jgi:hypothetical protein
MALTVKWWTDLKGDNDYKVAGKVAPETEFERKLKIYDKFREELDSLPAIKKAAQALAEVENARAKSMNDLQTTFPKLAAQCSPNGGRLLTQKISDEKKMLQEKTKEVTAKMALGAPQMQGLGPAGGNLRQKEFERLHDIIKKIHASLKSLATLNKDDIERYLNNLNELKKSVGLYCKDRPDAKQFLADFVGTLAGFNTVKEKWGTQKATEALKNIGTYLARMESAEYIK